MNSPTDSETARMLAEVRAARADMAERAKAPGWYHAALGLLTGGLAAVQGRPIPQMAAYYALFAIGLVFLIRAYKRHTGMWINGYRAGRTRWVAVGLAVLVTAVMLASVWLARERGVAFAAPVAGALIAVVVTLGGYVWEAAFRRDLRDGGSL